MGGIEGEDWKGLKRTIIRVAEEVLGIECVGGGRRRPTLVHGRRKNCSEEKNKISESIVQEQDTRE